MRLRCLMTISFGKMHRNLISYTTDYLPETIISNVTLNILTILTFLWIQNLHTYIKPDKAMGTFRSQCRNVGRDSPCSFSMQWNSQTINSIFLKLIMFSFFNTASDRCWFMSWIKVEYQPFFQYAKQQMAVTSFVCSGYKTVNSVPGEGDPAICRTTNTLNT